MKKSKYFRSRLDELIAKQDPKKVAAYVELASTHDIDFDHQRLRSYMMDDRMTANEAAVALDQSGLADRGLRQLYVIAKEERDAIFKYFEEPTIEDMAYDLSEGKEVIAYLDEISSLTQYFNRLGLEAQEGDDLPDVQRFKIKLIEAVSRTSLPPPSHESGARRLY